MIAAFIVGVPVRIHTFTGLIFPTEKGIKKLLLKNIDRLTCFFATNIYPEGNGVKTDLIFNHITTKPLIVLANGNVNGVDINYFDPKLFSKHVINNLKQDLNININDFIFLFVGRLVTDKGINELVEAFIKFNYNKNSKLILVGDFEHDEDALYTRTLEVIKSNIDIIFVGYKKDVRPYFAISDCFVFPSYREGFPNVVLQAGAMGLPCIVTDINGSNEIITDGENGLVIPPNNTEEIINKMKYLCDNKNIFNKMKYNARNMIINNYQQEQVWNSILNEYIKFEKSYF
jgi:glycosyltransferase involved in cell wall biosynthesis